MKRKKIRRYRDGVLDALDIIFIYISPSEESEKIIGKIKKLLTQKHKSNYDIPKQIT